MRVLFEIDTKDYKIGGTTTFRPSVRGIILLNGKIAMIYSQKYRYYKFPGGGVEEGETHIQTLTREVREEAGLFVIPSTVKEYGVVHRAEKGYREDIFIQDNYYYLCDVSSETVKQRLDPYEAQEQFTVEWIDPKEAIRQNRSDDHNGIEQIDHQFGTVCERESRVLELLLQEGYFTGSK